jgi:hypothetical protein
VVLAPSAAATSSFFASFNVLRERPQDAPAEPLVALSSASPRRTESERACLRDLIEILLPYPGGLRRWSIMRAIRSRREKRDQELPLRLEDEIERVFRKFCAGEPLSKGVKSGCMPEDVLFSRPKEKAGEVWAVDPHRARAWLTVETGMEFDAD